MKTKLYVLFSAIILMTCTQLSYTQNTLEVRVYPHLVGFDNGEQLPTLGQLDTAKYILNTIYNDKDIFFHYECPNIITSTAACGVGNNMCLLRPYFNRDGIDMFILPDKPANGAYYYPEVGFAEDIPGSAFYVSGINTLSIRCDYRTDPTQPGNPFTDAYLQNALDGASRNGIVAHEMGHCLGLIHTFENSSFSLGCITQHTINTCPELVDGSNCDSCGDLVCDTPADPLGFRCCEYVGTDVDANGDPYNPDVNNIMTYGMGFCRYNLTRGQAKRIKMEMQGRPEVYTGPNTPDCDLILCCDRKTKSVCLMDKSCQLQLGDYCDQICDYNWIQPPLGLNGPACVPYDPNTHYIVEVYTGTTSVTIQLKPNQSCHPKPDLTHIREDKAGTYGLLKETKFYPNPVSNQLTVKSALTNLKYQISDTRGQVILSNSLNFSSIDVSTLSSGVYIIKLISEDLEESIIHRIVKI